MIEEKVEGEVETQTGEETQTQETEQQVETKTETPSPVTETPPPKKAWFQSRIDELTAKRREIEAKLAEKDQEVALLNETVASLRAKGANGEDLLPASEIERRARQLAQQSTQEAAFTVQCNDAWTKGVAQYKEFPQEIENLKRAVGDAKGELPRELLDSALATDDPAAVLHALGTDLNKAAEIAAMPPAKQAIAMSKLMAAPQPKRESRANDPITPVVGTGSRQPSVYDDELDTAAWMEQRRKDLANTKQRWRH